MPADRTNQCSEGVEKSETDNRSEKQGPRQRVACLPSPRVLQGFHQRRAVIIDMSAHSARPATF
jgi:hypothetical protein